MTQDNLKITEAEEIVKHHTAMPYVLGGSCAKYQGLNKTLEYLHREHPRVFTLLTETRIKEIIKQTIQNEMT